MSIFKKIKILFSYLKVIKAKNKLTKAMEENGLIDKNDKREPLHTMSVVVTPFGTSLSIRLNEKEAQRRFDKRWAELHT